MNKRFRLKTGDKVEIIDGTSPYCGKRGEVVDLRCRNVRMLKGMTSSRVECYVKVKLEDTGMEIEFTLYGENSYEAFKGVLMKIEDSNRGG